jgi:hypothetical protein
LSDPAIQGLEFGSGMDGSFPGIQYMRGSGNFEAFITGNPFGGNALLFSERVEGHAGLDFLWNEIYFEDGEYTIQVVGHIDIEDEFDPASFVIAGSSSPWGWVGLEEFPDEETGDFEIIREFTVADGSIIDETNGAIGGNLRIRVHDLLNDYTIYQIAIVRAGTELPALPSSVAVPPFVRPIPGAGEGVIQLVIGSDVATVNGVSMTLDAAPFISSENRTMVPVRFIADAMGAVTDWDQASRTVTITPTSGDVITLVVGEALAGGMGTPEIVSSRTFVPVAFVATAMGNGVEWTQATQTVTITVGSGGGEGGEGGEENGENPLGLGADGIFVAMVQEGFQSSGVNIIIGEGTDVWPFAAGPEVGERAFVPEIGATYRVSFNVTNAGVGGWRVRWGRGSAGVFSDARYTAGDYAIVNNHPFSPDEVADVIPAHFNQNVSPDGTYTLVVEITLDGSQAYDELIGNITLTGTAGGNDYTVNWVTVEKDGEVIASWNR